MVAKYTSKYPQLSFYVDGALKRFSNGEFNTIQTKEIAVLDGLKDAVRIDDPKVTETNETKTEAKPKTSTRKASTK